jgi:hypothetical protein
VGDSIWPKVAVIVLVVGLIAMKYGARWLGRRARQRKIEETGKDPADNAYTRWQKRNPVLSTILGVVVIGGLLWWQIADTA